MARGHAPPPPAGTAPRVEELGTILGVWAHPDDEAYLSAGLMAAAGEAGQRVAVATATPGELGSPEPDGWDPPRTAALRRHELAASLAATGVGEHHWLGFADGTCAEVPVGVGAAAVGAVIDAVRPDTIVTFGPEGMTGHPDHRAVSAWTTAAWAERGGWGRLLYATLTPSFHTTWGAVNERLGIWMSGRGPSTAPQDLALLVECTGERLDRKLVALRAHASQTAPLVAALGVKDFARWWAAEAFVAAALPVGTRQPAGTIRNNHHKERSMKTFPGFTHVAVTVTDLSVSVPWYTRLFGADAVLDEDTGPFHHVVFAIGGGTLFGLHTFPDRDWTGDFDPARPGLDHVAFACADRAELAGWEQHLDELSVKHGGIVDAHYGSGLSFKDPDGVALEFFAPPA